MEGKRIEMIGDPEGIYRAAVASIEKKPVASDEQVDRLVEYFKLVMKHKGILSAVVETLSLYDDISEHQKKMEFLRRVHG